MAHVLQFLVGRPRDMRSLLTGLQSLEQRDEQRIDVRRLVRTLIAHAPQYVCVPHKGFEVRQVVEFGMV